MTFGFPLFEPPMTMTHAKSCHIETIEEIMASFGGRSSPQQSRCDLRQDINRSSKGPHSSLINHSSHHSPTHLPIFNPSFTHHIPIIYPSFSYHFHLRFPIVPGKPSSGQGLVRIHCTELRLRDAKEVAVEVLDA